MIKDFSPLKYLEDYRYRKLFKKYFRRNIFLDTFAFCLIIQGKFDKNRNKNTLVGDGNYFMNIGTYDRLMSFLELTEGKLIITPMILKESVNHISTAIENEYKNPKLRKEIEKQFLIFLQKELKIFKEKHPKIEEVLNHNWIEELEHCKLRDRLELGDLSIFVESEKCKFCSIVTRDSYKKNKDGECIELENVIIVQLDSLVVI